MTEQSWFAAYMDRWARHDLDAVLESVTDDIVHEDVALGVIASGRAEFARFVSAAFAHPVESYDIVSFVDDGDRFAAEWIMQPMAVRGASTGRRVGGLIAEQRDYWNAT